MSSSQKPDDVQQYMPRSSRGPERYQMNTDLPTPSDTVSPPALNGQDQWGYAIEAVKGNDSLLGQELTSTVVLSTRFLLINLGRRYASKAHWVQQTTKIP